jgi:glycogen(starch) synthase
LGLRRFGAGHPPFTAAVYAAAMAVIAPSRDDSGRPLRVLRLCACFMPPDEVLAGKGHRFDPIGGMQNHTAELTRALDSLGVAQTVVTTRFPGAPSRARRGAQAEVLRLGLPIRRFRQLYSVPSMRLLPRLAAQADLVHAHLGEDLAVLPLAAHAARRNNIPLVVTVHCSLRHTLTAVDPRTALLKAVGGPIEAWAEALADAIICLTPRLAGKLVGNGVAPERVFVVPSGVNPRVFRGSEEPVPWPPDLEGPVVAFVGRLARQKGPHVLLQAARRLSGTGAVFVFVGDGEERASLERAAARHGLLDRVVFTGFVAHDRVPSVLAHADLLVLPSIYEELGSILIEAMQAGLPIVASDTGGIPDAITHEENGLLVPSGRPIALADAIARVLGDPCLARRLSRAARRRAADYEWDALGARVLDVYTHVLGRRLEPRAPHDIKSA